MAEHGDLAKSRRGRAWESLRKVERGTERDRERDRGRRRACARREKERGETDKDRQV